LKKMKSRNVKVVVALGLAAAAVALGSKLAIADLLASSTPAATTAPVGKPAPALESARPGPEAGLSDSQRMDLHQQVWNTFEQRYTAWVNALRVDQLDLPSLPRHPLNALVLPGQGSLRDAVVKADLIVVGTVSAIRPTIGGTDTTFSVRSDRQGVLQPLARFHADWAHLPDCGLHWHGNSPDRGRGAAPSR
jgi:hypothetical protein